MVQEDGHRSGEEICRPGLAIAEGESAPGAAKKETPLFVRCDEGVAHLQAQTGIQLAGNQFDFRHLPLGKVHRTAVAVLGAVESRAFQFFRHQRDSISARFKLELRRTLLPASLEHGLAAGTFQRQDIIGYKNIGRARERLLGKTQPQHGRIVHRRHGRKTGRMHEGRNGQGKKSDFCFHKAFFPAIIYKANIKIPPQTCHKVRFFKFAYTQT